MEISTIYSPDQYANLFWRQKPARTCVFAKIFWSATWNLEWARKSMEILTSYVLISAGNYAGFTYFPYFLEKVLTWKLFVLLVESPFTGWFFPFKTFIEKVLIWSVFNLLVFLFERCLFLEFPSFSGQFERKIQNLEWGPLDLTLATFAVFTKQLELRMPAHLHQKVLYAGVTYFLFSIFCCKSIDLKAFHAFGLAFCWLPFPWSSYFKRSIWAENPKFRMRPIGFNTCNFCCIY